MAILAAFRVSRPPSNPHTPPSFPTCLQGRVPPPGPQSGPQAEGNGSGFVWDTAGHVVTNWHVLQNVLGGAAGKVLPGAKVAQVFVQGGQTVVGGRMRVVGGWGGGCEESVGGGCGRDRTCTWCAAG